MYKVYLAGPISGLSYDDCVDWRDYTIKKLPTYIKGISPMRGKAYLSAEDIIRDSYAETVLSCTKGITARDRFDACRCDVVLFNFVGAKRVSIGSCIEVGWADANRIPIVVAIDKDNPHEHGMITETAGFIVPTLDDAIDTVIAILTP